MKQILQICLVSAGILGWIPTTIGSAPAARKTDLQACPMMCSPYVPHNGGPILTGNATVLICGQPAARVTDQALCSCAQATIAFGLPTVLIGGQPAARIGDLTSHGGTITTGCCLVKLNLVVFNFGLAAVTEAPRITEEEIFLLLNFGTDGALYT